ncbi:MAG: ABC transporter permease, partial [Beijerinckiaceae bacterium]
MTDAAALASPALRRKPRAPGKVAPVAAIVAFILAIWYMAAIPLNAPIARMQAQNAGTQLAGADLVAATWSMERPVLPAPHQIAKELWNTVFAMDPTSRRSLVYHAWITLSATLLGFFIGALFGVALATLIVHSRTLNQSLMPWIIASQTIPILAIAPIIIVV